MQEVGTVGREEGRAVQKVCSEAHEVQRTGRNTQELGRVEEMVGGRGGTVRAKRALEQVWKSGVARRTDIIT